MAAIRNEIGSGILRIVITGAEGVPGRHFGQAARGPVVIDLISGLMTLRLGNSANDGDTPLRVPLISREWSRRRNRSRR
ncbi:hypothetical protein [Salipiger mucosus]|uniref:hypothetical protein n=1 Tax=Salipiger mucosus TaxID=263378 RepID=UPI0012ECA1E9|nr:hypothetical protein [Salipiger mucosus]